MNFRLRYSLRCKNSEDGEKEPVNGPLPVGGAGNGCYSVQMGPTYFLYLNYIFKIIINQNVSRSYASEQTATRSSVGGLGLDTERKVEYVRPYLNGDLSVHSDSSYP